MKILKRVLPGLLILAALAVWSVIHWLNSTAEPTDTAMQALESNEQVIVAHGDRVITFMPADESPTTGFIFYPGAGVDFRSYAPPLKMIAAQGYLVAAVRVNLNLAFFDVNAADRVIVQFPEIEHWAVGGHSLGGVAASRYASRRADAVDGVVFWASYPADDSLLNAGIEVISIFGTLDGLATPEKIEASRKLLPAGSEYLPITGGNHSQFGSYGGQSGDNPASISPQEQWIQVAEATTNFLEILKEK